MAKQTTEQIKLDGKIDNAISAFFRKEMTIPQWYLALCFVGFIIFLLAILMLIYMNDGLINEYNICVGKLI